MLKDLEQSIPLKSVPDAILRHAKKVFGTQEGPERWLLYQCLPTLIVKEWPRARTSALAHADRLWHGRHGASRGTRTGLHINVVGEPRSI
jgi:hypothetical protein